MRAPARLQSYSCPLTQLWCCCWPAPATPAAAARPHAHTTMRALACLGLLAAGVHAGVSFVPATDPRVLTAGRTRINGDGSRSWDWEGVSFTITLSGASRVQVVANTTTSVGARLMTTLTSPADNFAGFVASEVWIDPSFNVSGYTLAEAGAFTPSLYHLPLLASGGLRVAVDPSSLYTVAAGLNPSKTYTLRVFSEVEPAFEGSGVANVNTLAGFVTDGTLAAAAPLARSIEFVGDSITVRAACVRGGQAAQPPPAAACSTFDCAPITCCCCCCCCHHHGRGGVWWCRWGTAPSAAAPAPRRRTRPPTSTRTTATCATTSPPTVPSSRGAGECQCTPSSCWSS